MLGRLARPSSARRRRPGVDTQRRAPPTCPGPSDSLGCALQAAWDARSGDSTAVLHVPEATPWAVSASVLLPCLPAAPSGPDAAEAFLSCAAEDATRSAGADCFAELMVRVVRRSLQSAASPRAGAFDAARRLEAVVAGADIGNVCGLTSAVNHVASLEEAVGPDSDGAAAAESAAMLSSAVDIELLQAVVKRLGDVARLQLGSRGFFSHSLPPLSRRLASLVPSQTRADGSESDDPPQWAHATTITAAVNTARGIVALSRLGSWEGLVEGFTLLPLWLQRHPLVAGRHLGAAAFALRHRLSLPPPDALRSFLPPPAASSTTPASIDEGDGIDADSALAEPAEVSMVHREDDAKEAGRIRGIADLLLRVWFDAAAGRGGGSAAAVDVDALRHGVAALISLNSVSAAAELVPRIDALETAKRAAAAAGKAGDGSATSGAHWTSIDMHARRGELPRAIACAAALATSRDAGGGWGKAPTVVVEAVQRLSSRMGCPRLWSEAWPPSRLLVRGIAAVALFRCANLRPHAVVEGAVSGFRDWLFAAASAATVMSIGDATDASASQLVSEMQQGALQFAGALADVAPYVGIEAAFDFATAVATVFGSKLPGSKRTAAVCRAAALALWHVASALKNSPMAEALGTALHSFGRHAGADVQHLLSLVPSVATSLATAADDADAAAQGTRKLWQCPACSTTHSTVTDACRHCGASRWPQLKCGSCDGAFSVSDAVTMSAASPARCGEPLVGHFDCAKCGRLDSATAMSALSCSEPRAISAEAAAITCRGCGGQSTRQGFCMKCGLARSPAVPDDRQRAWECAGCSRWRPWDEPVCVACDVALARMPACRTVPWGQAVASTAACGSCGTVIDTFGLLRTKCPSCQAALPPQVLDGIGSSPHQHSPLGEGRGAEFAFAAAAQASVQTQPPAEPTPTSASATDADTNAAPSHGPTLCVECPTCGYVSPAATDKCGGCGAANLRDGATFPSTGWVCNECDAEQPPNNVSAVCSSCKALRAAEYAVPTSAVGLVAVVRALATLQEGPMLKRGLDALQQFIDAPGNCDLRQRIRGLSEAAAALSTTGAVASPQDEQLAEALRGSITKVVAVASARSATLSTNSERSLACTAHRVGLLVGVAVLPEQRCAHCAGSHPEAMCPLRPHPRWACDACAAENSNVGTTRYVCGRCLAVRPLVMELGWAEAWECEGCGRVSCECDDACAHCSAVRANAPPKGEEDDAAVPFFPARCGACGAAHLEALCPECDRDSVVREEVRRGRAIVLGLLPDGTAELQPCGTSAPALRVTVPAEVAKQALAGKRRRVVGTTVEFDARAGGEGDSRRLYATSLTTDA